MKIRHGEKANPTDILVDHDATNPARPIPGYEGKCYKKRLITYRGKLVGEPELRSKRLRGTYATAVPLHLATNADPGRVRVKEIV